MDKSTSIRTPRDVLRWIAAEAAESEVELHAGLELSVEGMVRTVNSSDQADVERYMRENGKLEAAVQRMHWLEYGPFETEETYLLTESGAEEIAALVSFEQGLDLAAALVGLELHGRSREFEMQLRQAKHEAAQAGALNSGRARLQQRALIGPEL